MNNWVIYNKKQNIREISSEFGITPLTAVLLCNRDIKEKNDIEKILSSDINDLNSPSLLYDIDNASSIIKKYVIDKKHIRIVGDYDVDGVISTYILYDALKNVGANVSYAIPDRVLDGYGINISIIDKAIEDKVDLIITCDNGIAAGEQITYAKSNGIEVIVTDHHDVINIPKDALSVVNPKINDEKNKYPFKNICGATVAFKLIIRFYELYLNEICKKNNIENINDIINPLDNYLEFVMLATISDIMPLVNENHIIVKLGLKKILKTKNKGLKKLIEISHILDKNNVLNVFHIGFIIGPLINAAGRMENASLALELLLSKDDDFIESSAIKLKDLNEERKKMTENGTLLAIEKIETNYKDDKILVVYVENLGEQVAGIVAGRIKDRYNKPTIILTDTKNENEKKASCRSIEKYDIFTSLSKHKDLFIKFGGHKLAAGFSIFEENIDLLRKLLNEETNLVESDFVKKIYIDAEFPLTEIDENIIKDIEKLEPFGESFKTPLFVTKDVKTTITNIYGVDKNVIKLMLSKDGKKGSGILFSDSVMFSKCLKEKSELDILYYPKINEFNGVRNVEINVEDYR